MREEPDLKKVSDAELLRSLAGGSLPRDPSNRTVAELDSIADSFLTFHIDRYRGLRSLRVLGDLQLLRKRSLSAPDVT